MGSLAPTGLLAALAFAASVLASVNDSTALGGILIFSAAGFLLGLAGAILDYGRGYNDGGHHGHRGARDR